MERPGQYWNHIECRWEAGPAQLDVVVPEQARDEPAADDLSVPVTALPAGTD